MKKFKLIFLAAGITVTIFILVPISFYIFKFEGTGLASDPQAWGVFGDYFGGVLDPIISLASLFLIGYLTYLVAQQTNKKSKRLFILERRMIAYDGLVKNLNSVNSFSSRLKAAVSMLPIYEKLSPDQAQLHILKVVEELGKLGTGFIDFHAALFEFNPRYGHLFKYNFSLTEYKDLLIESQRVRDLMLTLISSYQEISNLTEEEKSLKRFSELLFPVIVALRAEVETKLD